MAGVSVSWSGCRERSRGVSRSRKEPQARLLKSVCVCIGRTRLHQVHSWLMGVDEVQQRAVLSWPPNLYIRRAEVPATPPSQWSSF